MNNERYQEIIDEERCLSWEERDFPILRHSTKLITVTYQENKIEIYD